MEEKEIVRRLRLMERHFERYGVRIVDDLTPLCEIDCRQVCAAALDVLEKVTVGVPPEMEGGGSNWWAVCGECHGAIDERDAFCRHCGTRVMKATD